METISFVIDQLISLIERQMFNFTSDKHKAFYTAFGRLLSSYNAAFPIKAQLIISRLMRVVEY